jgi:ABC-type hemin transport system ATPase subunit
LDNRLIELKDITKSFGTVRALDNVTMHVNQPEVVGLIGDNGAGKSTLIKICQRGLNPIRGKKVGSLDSLPPHWPVLKPSTRIARWRCSIPLRAIFAGREIWGLPGLINVQTVS